LNAPIYEDSQNGNRLRMMSTRTILLLLIPVFFLAVSGCASVRQKEAWGEFRALARETYPQDEDTQPVSNLPELSEGAALEDYLVYAALNNAGLEAAFNDWKAELEKTQRVSALPDPKFTYTHYVREVETRVGPQRRAYTLMQMFPWYGKLRLRGDIAFEASEAARARYDAAKLKVFHRVKVAYYEYYYLAQVIAITDENIRLISNLEAVARAKFRAGMPNHPAIIKAQVELGKLEDRLNTLKALRGPTIARLNAAMGRPVDEDLPWPGTLVELEIALDDEQIFDWLRESSPDLRALASTVAKEKKSAELAEKDYFPDITLGATFVDTDEALNPDMLDSGKDPVMAAITLNLPLWIGRYRAAAREARARLAAATKRHEDREVQLSAELKLAVFHFRDAERKIDLYGNTLLPKAEQALSASQRAFAAGTADFFDLIEAERTLLEFQLSHERARVDRLERLSEIETLVGREMP
jgi:cobalt-zinc-cadmium efflux system outer membrane protein